MKIMDKTAYQSSLDDILDEKKGQQKITKYKLNK